MPTKQRLKQGHFINMRVKPDLWRELKRLADADMRPLTQYVTKVLRAHVQKESSPS